MLLKPSEYYKIKMLIGEPVKYSSIGGFFLKKAISNADLEYLNLLNAKCVFQKYESGLLIYFTIHNNTSALVVPYNTIVKSMYIEGVETITVYRRNFPIVFKSYRIQFFLDRYFIRPWRKSKDSNTYTLNIKTVELEFYSMAYSRGGAVNFFKTFEKK